MRLTSQDHADPSSLQLYLACFLHIIPSTKTIQDEFIPVVCSPFPHFPNRLHLHPNKPAQFPFWALVSFGSYLLFKLGWGVFTFNDVPEAYNELMGEIEVARKELKSKGIDVD